MVVALVIILILIIIIRWEKRRGLDGIPDKDKGVLALGFLDFFESVCLFVCV